MSRWLPPLLLIAACAVFLGDAGRVMRPKNAVAQNPGVRKVIQINGETFYLSVEDIDTWYNARTKCGILGMQLVTLDTPERWAMIEEFMLSHIEYNWLTWTSGHKSTGHEHFVWDTTGDNFTYYDWNNFEPDAEPGEEACVDFFAGKRGWNDDPCMSVALQYMCESIRTDVPQ